jgi:hypothetical protein
MESSAFSSVFHDWRYGIVMNRIGVDENIMKRQRRENGYETRKTD